VKIRVRQKQSKKANVAQVATVLPPESIASTIAELERLEWLDDPLSCIHNRLHEVTWSKQNAIVDSVHRHRKTAVRSCHASGKTWLAARIAATWLTAHRSGDAFVVTTAPTGRQVRAILWREIGRVHGMAKLPGRTNQTEWYMEMITGKEELVAFGMKPDDFSPTAFQGIHARFVLVIFDEADGIAQALWDAADSLVANDASRFLAIGNPDNPLSEFARVCQPGSGFNVLSISAFDTPNFTHEQIPKDVADQLVGHIYVEEKRRKWAPNWQWVDSKGTVVDAQHGIRVVPPPGVEVTTSNPLWQSKVLGQFPNQSRADSLIPIQWILRSQRADLPPIGANHLGVDVGGGGDASTIAHRRGPVIRIIHEDHNPDTMQTTGALVGFIKTTGAALAKIDAIGIGKGVTDRATEVRQELALLNDEAHQPKWEAVAVGVGESPWPADTFEYPEGMDPEGFLNLRAQLYWYLRIAFERNRIDIDPDDLDLAAELVEIKYKRTSAGKIQIESKAEAKRRGVASPNRTEAVMLSLAPKPPDDMNNDSRLVW
jgi:hypothetical protein